MDKDRFHKIWLKNLRDLANRLELPNRSYEIRSNKGGDGVLGEVVLHSKWFYVMVGGSLYTDANRVMYRTCDGLADYSGGRNLFSNTQALVDMALDEQFRRMRNDNGLRRTLGSKDAC